MHELNNLTSLNFSFHSGSAYSTTGVDQFLNKLIVWADFIWAVSESAYSTTTDSWTNDSFETILLNFSESAYNTTRLNQFLNESI